MGKKNVDDIFQEKFKEFSELPNDKVWQSIEASLDAKKDRRRIIPIWWKIGGAAAVLLLGLFFVNPFENTRTETVITDTNSTKTIDEKTNPKKAVDYNPRPTKQDSSTDDFVQKTNDTNSITNTKDKQLTNITKGGNLKKSATNANSNNINSTQISNLAEKTPEEKYAFKKLPKKTNFLVKNKGYSDSLLKKENLFNENLEITNTHNKSNQEKELTQIAESVILETIDEANKKSIFDEIASNEEESNAKETENKWSAGPSLAPVFFNAIGEGSPIHATFSPNSKSGETSLSYGLAVAYAVNKKLSIRSGLHKVNFGYNTNDVEFYSSVGTGDAIKINNVDYNATASGLAIRSVSNAEVSPAFDQMPAVDNASPEVSNPEPTTTKGTMEQQYGYIEVPLELNYAILDKRFGITLIGGVSSLFLVDNTISVSSDDLSSNVGKANNLNSINFSTNVGLGFNYKFNKKIKINIEPLFKYQLNTFSSTDGTFHPFSIGVYSGLSYKF